MGVRLHHIGIAVRDIRQAAEEFVDLLGYEAVTEIGHETTQTVFYQFLRLPSASWHVEFVAPDGDTSVIAQAVKRGGGLHHLCYATDDIQAACDRLYARGMVVIREPVPGIAFGGRRIAWLMGQSRLLTELLEEGDDLW